MDLRTFEELLAPVGQSLLEEIGNRDAEETELRLGTRLRRRHNSALVAAALNQDDLRRRARLKFGTDAATMYFTQQALEQSTRAVVSRHRAARMASSDSTSLIDLGCGIGGDLIAFARAGLDVRGVELDPLRAAIAAANLNALQLIGTIECGDATEFQRRPDAAVFVDPARRDGSGRIFDPRNCVPPWDFVVEMLKHNSAVKTMPGISHELVPPAVEAEWISDGGKLVEACLWGAPLASVARRATLLPSAATLSNTDDHGADVLIPGRYLYEPDDAVIRAGLVTAVAPIVDGWLIDPHIAWISSNQFASTPFARAFKIVAELPFREKQLKAALVARDIGNLTIKKRGVNVVPETLIGKLKLKGAESGTLVMTRVAGQGRAFLVDPLD